MKENIKKITIFCLNLFRDYSWRNIEKQPEKLKKRAKRYAFVINLFPFIKFEWFWQKNIHELKNCAFNRFERLFHEIDDYSKFIISKLLFFSKLLDNENCKVLLDFANNTSIPEYRYWVTQDISRFIFLLQSGFYPEYYNDRRELLKHVVMDMRLTTPNKKNEESDKLCIVTHLLADSERNSVQRCVNMICKGLMPYFLEIQVFPLDTFTPVGKERRELTTVLPYKAAINSKKQIEELLPKGVKVHYPEGGNYKEKAQDTLNAIYDYNPCAILDMSDEYSAISYIYSKDFYTVYLPLRDTNSSLFFNVITGAPKWKFVESNVIFNSIDINLVKEWSFPEHVPLKNNIHTRDNLLISEDAFVMISVGNNATTFSKEFVDEMCTVVSANNFIWLLVGQNAPEYMKNTYKHLYDNHLIIEYGYEQELYSLCSICNVLVRPNMTGGSGATAIAAMAGLPIAMTNALCDPSRWLGSDFHSNIITYNDLANYIVELSVDMNYYKSERNKVISLVNDAIDSPEKWKALANILKGEDECVE